MHPTRAGLLMFGYEYEIAAEYPNYFLDYKESFGDGRWDDRIVTSSGDWSGNVFDFWLRVSPKLTANLKRPFALDGLYRVDNTPLHGALREALVNMLFHADYYGETNSTAVKSEFSVAFSNSGTMLVPLDVAEMGGISSTRNPTLSSVKNSQAALEALLDVSASIRRSDVEEALGVSKATATKLVDLLVQEGRLAKQGAGRATRYLVKNYTK